MKVLWLTNIPTAEASLLLNETPLPFGGWLGSGAFALSHQPDIELFVAFPRQGTKDVNVLNGDRISYLAFPPMTRNIIKNPIYCDWLLRILEIVQPNIVHIHGTEFFHASSMISLCNRQNIDVVLSIQGLVSVCAKHYMACIPEHVQKRFTLRDFLKQDNLMQQQRTFVERGEFEIEAIKKIKHVIGRTTWDRACVSQINPDAQYHFCNESLRDEFYKNIWNIDICEKYSIFVSQGSYPLKGLHHMLEAMTTILKRYPDTKLYVGGQDITKSNTLTDKIKISSYGKYIKDLIGINCLQKNVVFTGILDERQICERYLHSHVFVCPSSIENSPNSLGEAMLLGVPCVAADVGGITDMMTHMKEGFIYQADAPYMLAHYVCQIFASSDLANKFSQSAHIHAIKTHDRETNVKSLLDIYETILR